MFPNIFGPLVRLRNIKLLPKDSHGDFSERAAKFLVDNLAALIIQIFLWMQANLDIDPGQPVTKLRDMLIVQ